MSRLVISDAHRHHQSVPLQPPGGLWWGGGAGGGDFALAAKAWHLALVICVPVAGHWAFLDLE